jgi:hypothetical protein
MTIEILVYPALVFLAVAMIAKFIERQRDVLYGPYIQGRKTAFAEISDQLDTVMARTGLRREYGRFAMKFTTASILASAIMG